MAPSRVLPGELDAPPLLTLALWAGGTGGRGE